MAQRHPSSRAANELRPVSIKRRFTQTAPGSVLLQAGETLVLCTASVDTNLPPWKKDLSSGWVTAEYNMLPGSTSPRRRRDRGSVDSRTTEIQRLIGRSLRAVVDLEALGPIQVVVDCEVLQADGGTRTACITGGWIALVDAIASIRASLPDPSRNPIRQSLAAVSVGIVGGHVQLDLDYAADVAAAVDMNVVMTGDGQFVEIQGTGERTTFSRRQLSQMLSLAEAGIQQLIQAQRRALGKAWPLTD